MPRNPSLDPSLQELNAISVHGFYSLRRSGGLGLRLTIDADV
jgi:hypothetical protein